MPCKPRPLGTKSRKRPHAPPCKASRNRCDPNDLNRPIRKDYQVFAYSPGEIADLAQSIGGAASHLESIRSSATNALVAVREEFEGQGGGSFEHAQMLINSGIDEGVEVCNRHS